MITAALATGIAFTCQVASIHDGDTFRCADGTRVRLSAIDTPEMPGACQRGRQFAPGDPHAARNALAGMIAGRTVQCRRVGMSYNRVVALCSVGRRDLSCAMWRSGYAVASPPMIGSASYAGDKPCPTKQPEA